MVVADNSGEAGQFLAGTLSQALLLLSPTGHQALSQRPESTTTAPVPRVAASPSSLAINRAEQFDTAVFDHQPLLLLALMAAAAGRHHLLVYGPPGSGKTMSLRFLGSLLPALDEAARLEVNRLYSLAGMLTSASNLIQQAPVRMPHHGSSPEALLGGGKRGLPGEMSLAHHGLLILDEAPEFRSAVLQALREPMEDGQIRLGRANGALWFPAAFILGLSLNPCPCGRLGSGRGACACSGAEVQRYWGRIGAPVMDRIDIRFSLGMAGNKQNIFPVTVDHRDPQAIRACVHRARQKSGGNAWLQGRQVDELCLLSTSARRYFEMLSTERSLLGRSRHGILRLAKTIAELGGKNQIDEAALSAAFCLRAPIEVLPGLAIME